NGEDNTVDSTSTNQGSQAGESRSLTQSTAEAILSETQTGGGNQHPPPHGSGSQTADNKEVSTSTIPDPQAGESRSLTQSTAEAILSETQTGGGNQHPPPHGSGSQTYLKFKFCVFLV
ncbi:hypothetical protein HMI56_005871, partial [Coelomomyces lativittatus]